MKKICDFFCHFRNLGLLAAAAGLGALLFAWTMQSLGYLPCHLCYVQRKPYMLIIVFGLLAAVFSKKWPRAAFVLLVYAGIASLTGAAVAVFHFGTEQGWWPLLQGCMQSEVLPDISNMSVEEMMKMYENIPTTRCDVPGWVFLGISMTGWNFLYASGLGVFTLFHAIMGRCNVSKA